MKSVQYHPQSCQQGPSKKESRRVGNRRTLILAQSPGVHGLAGEVRIEELRNHLASSQYCICKRKRENV